MSNQYFLGNPPAYGEVIVENEKWELYDRFKQNGDWSAFKLVSKEPRLHKANYWIGWNGERFARNRDFCNLEANAPDVVEWLTKELS
jgi:hypothetical protein